jgi:anti-sigma-K factor RskA
MTLSIRQERLFELLADKALIGVANQDAIELAELLREFPNGDDGSFERAAAATAIAGLEGKIDALPPQLAERIAAEAESSVPTMARKPLTDEHTVAMAGRPGQPPAMQPPVISPPMTQPPPAQVLPFPPPSRPQQAPMPMKKASRWPLVVSWMAAAACLALAAGVFWKYRPREPVAVVPSKDREQLVGKPGTATVAWTATEDPASKKASGDVVWNASLQQGYMRFRGLAKNDPKATQYQLWIFDKTRDDKYPVDGGVFDVDKETGDVIVPIRAKIHVNEATLFAVTVERPGGVVVSKRERIVVTAKLGG